jgi:hypothetical protein
MQSQRTRRKGPVAKSIITINGSEALQGGVSFVSGLKEPAR